MTDNQPTEDCQVVKKEKALRDYDRPDPAFCRSNIVIPPVDECNHEVELSIIQLLRENPFEGDIVREDPYAHLKEFLEICDTFKYNNVPDEIIRRRLFPFSLTKKAKDWLRDQPSSTFTSWTSLSGAFLAKYFPYGKTTRLRKDIVSFVQGEDETLSNAWERFTDMLRKCPHHGLPKWMVVETFYAGLCDSERMFVNAAAGGSLMEKTPEAAFALLEERAENDFQWNYDGGQPRMAARVVETEEIRMLSAKIEVLTKKLEELNVNFRDVNKQQNYSYSTTYKPDWDNGPHCLLGGQGTSVQYDSQANMSLVNQDVFNGARGISNHADFHQQQRQSWI